jgi:transposase-like protein
LAAISIGQREFEQWNLDVSALRCVPSGSKSRHFKRQASQEFWCHAPGKREWARDDDGDGIREVHNNTLEGIGTGLRNFLRPFRGVHEKYLDQYVAIFEWAHNLKTATVGFLRALLGVLTPNAP